MFLATLSTLFLAGKSFWSCLVQMCQHSPYQTIAVCILGPIEFYFIMGFYRMYRDGEKRNNRK